MSHGKPLTNSEVAARQREIEAKAKTKSVGTGVAQVSQSYTFGHYQVVWAGANKGGSPAEVRDNANNDAIVFRGTKDECVDWAKSKS